MLSYNLGVGHFVFNMANILTQNHKLVLPENITMQYKVNTPKTLATRDN